MFTGPGTSDRAPMTLTVYALANATFFGASSAPTPLYRVYQDAWGFSSGILTVVFASYALSLLVALLVTGSLSDHVGRRPVILGGIALEALAMLVFAGARSVEGLIVARVIQGFATGMATSALGAAIVDANPAKGPLVNTVTPLLGMGVGALGAGLLVQYASAPMRLVFILLVAILALQMALVWTLPDTVSRKAGALASLRPSIQVPAAARGAMLRVTPANIAVWALGGFFLSLGPMLARAVTGIGDATMGGGVVFVLTIGGVAAVVGLRKLGAADVLTIGCCVLAGGLLVTLAAVHAGSTVLFFLGTLCAGVGFGAAFQGTLRSVLPLAEAHERAGLMAAFYVMSYLAFSLPAIGAGLAVRAIGLRSTTDAYGFALVALALTTALAARPQGRAVR